MVHPLTHGENVTPHPHIEFAFGFSNTKRDPIISSLQSMWVPNTSNDGTSTESQQAITLGGPLS